MLRLIAVMETSDWLLVAVVLMICFLVAVTSSAFLWYMHREQVKRRESEVEWNGEIVATLQSLHDQVKSHRRGINSIIKRLDGHDNIARDELREAKRLILDVEERLRHEMTETKDIVRDTRSQVTNIHNSSRIQDGQTNLGVVKGDQVNGK